MRRPLIGLCFAEALGILLAHCGLVLPGHLCIVCAGVFVALGMRRDAKLLPLALCGFFLLGMVRMDMLARSQAVLPGWEGRVAELSGVVTSVDARERYLALTLSADRGGPAGQAVPVSREKVLVRLELERRDQPVAFPYGLVGRRVTCTGRISLPQGPRNPGGFDYRLYLLGKNIRAICQVSRYRFESGNVERPLLHWLSVTKGEFLQKAEKRMSRDGFALLAGSLFGEKSYIQEDAYEGFRRSGMGHIFAVSGLHVGLLYAVLLKLTREWRKDASFCLMLGALLTYAALSDFSVSVLRASAMTVAAMLARPLRCRYDLTSAASGAALVLMTANPFQLFDAGFQLSFLAAYSLGIALPFVELRVKELADRYKKAWITSLASVLGPCAVIQTAMAPLISYHFLLFAPAGFLVNPPALILAGLLLPVGLLMFVVSAACPPAAWCGSAGIFVSEVVFSALSGMAESLCSAMMRLSDLAGAAPGGAVPAPPIGALVLFYALFFFYFSETRFVLLRKGHRRRLSALFLTLLAAGLALPRVCGISSTIVPWKYSTPMVTFLDVGQGDCIHVQAGRFNVLVDGGGSLYREVGKTVLEPFLLKNGITRIDLAFVTHADLDHRKGIQELSRRMTVETLALPLPYKERPESFSDVTCREVIYLSAGDVVSLGKKATFRVLSPPESAAGVLSENDSSLVMMLEYGGVKILLTGDLEQSRESRLKGPLECDILKVAHHGSAGSTGPGFLSAASPDFAVISCGKNNVHGHPAPRVIELLEKSGIMIGRTDEDGALCLRSVSPSSFLLENAARELFWRVERKDPE